VLFAWLITFPKCGPLPHSSHFIAINIPVQSTENVQNVSHHSSRPRRLFPLAIRARSMWRRGSRGKR
jgi:hypothetical protein